MSELDSSAAFAAVLKHVMAESKNERALAEQFCSSPMRGRFLSATFRCKTRRCVLAYIYQTPRGIIVHQPAYKLSESVNQAESNEAGRARNTTDGNRKWKAQCFFLHDSVDHTLNCDHVRQVVSAAEIQEAAERHTDRTW